MKGCEVRGEEWRSDGLWVKGLKGRREWSGGCSLEDWGKGRGVRG